MNDIYMGLRVYGYGNFIFVNACIRWIRAKYLFGPYVRCLALQSSLIQLTIILVYISKWLKYQIIHVYSSN